MKLEAHLEVWDSPNSAGVVIDALRCVKLGLDRGIGGPLDFARVLFYEDPSQAV